MTNKQNIVEFKSQSFKAKRVVIVDDQMTIRNLLSELVSNIDPTIEIHLYSDAESALKFIFSKRVDLILTDLKMPKLNGINFIEKVRATHSIDELPILMVTGAEDNSSMYKAIEAGATDFISHPIELKKFIKRVSKLLTDSYSKRPADLLTFPVALE